MMQHCLSQRAAFPPAEGYTHSPKGVIPGTMCSISFATLSILIEYGVPMMIKQPYQKYLHFTFFHYRG